MLHRGFNLKFGDKMSLESLTDVERGFVVTAAPTLCMALASLLLSNMEVGKLMESLLQYFAAGLILAAVAAELFPLMLEGVTQADSMAGITVGFAVGIAMVYGMDSVMELFGVSDDDEGEAKSESGEGSAKRPSLRDSFSEVGVVDEASTFGMQIVGLQPRATTSALPAGDDETMKELQLYQGLSPEPQGDWNDDDLSRAEQAILNPSHRDHVKEHVKEICDAVDVMLEQSLQLMDEGSQHTVREQEELAEKIDEGVHKLQYLVDHTRRLVEGAEADVTGVAAKVWLTEDRKRTMRRRVLALKYCAEHLNEHVSEAHIDAALLKEIHGHMDDMDKQITFFHDSVQKAASKWGRKAYTLPEPELGDELPMSLVVPVTLDCFVDGFLIGVTCAIAPKAGIILGAANCLEMGSLGMAYAVRLKRCTGTRPSVRFLALFLPPILMFLSSGIGAALGQASQAVPAVYVGFVAFGVVALLALSLNELIVEAKASLDEAGAPETLSAVLFLAIWIVLMIDVNTPQESGR